MLLLNVDDFDAFVMMANLLHTQHFLGNLPCQTLTVFCLLVCRAYFTLLSLLCCSFRCFCPLLSCFHVFDLSAALVCAFVCLFVCVFASLFLLCFHFSYGLRATVNIISEFFRMDMTAMRHRFTVFENLLSVSPMLSSTKSKPFGCRCCLWCWSLLFLSSQPFPRVWQWQYWQSSLSHYDLLFTVVFLFSFSFWYVCLKFETRCCCLCRDGGQCRRIVIGSRLTLPAGDAPARSRELSPSGDSPGHVPSRLAVHAVL